jgi:transcriptional regulator with XRE-family HTH domain
MDHPLRKFRNAASPKISLADFADQIGITAASLSRIERGKQNPPVETLRKIVQATGGKVPADALLGTQERVGGAS